MKLFLTGRRGVGKTSVCQAMVGLARARGRSPQGVLSISLFDESGVKVGFEAMDAGSGQRWLLGHTTQPLEGPRIGPYVLDSHGLARAIDVLKRACNTPDLMVLDEVGPLELERNEGFAPVLDILPLEGPGHLLVVVRPSLLPQVRQRLGRDGTIYTVSEGNRDVLPAHMVQELWPDA